MITTVIFILGFVVLLAVLVAIHEAGHFFVAKATDVKVVEFGLGFPPRLWGVQKGETLYSINAIPLGAFVKMVGEEDPSEPRSLASKSVLVRFLVIAAGPFMNAVMALVLFTAIFLFPQDVPLGPLAIISVAPDSPAQAAGLLPGDQIIAADGRALDIQTDFASLINSKLGQPMTWTVRRNSQNLVMNITPRVQPPQGQGPTGIVLTPVVTSQTMPPWTAAASGLRSMGGVLTATANEFTKWFQGGKAPQFAGPIGLGQAFTQVEQDATIPVKDRMLEGLSLAAAISWGLAIFNILPLPALDGGRLPFLLYEWVRRGKRVPPKVEAAVHLIGFALLMSMGVLIGVVDIMRIFHGGSLLGG